MIECVSRSNVDLFSASVQLEEPDQTGLEPVNLDCEPVKCRSQNWRENNLNQAFVESVPFNDIKQKVIFLGQFGLLCTIGIWVINLNSWKDLIVNFYFYNIHTLWKTVIKIQSM